jgi:hypothetical protein
MAVADVAVAMGPRNQRRLAGGAAALAVLLALGAALMLLGRSGGSGPVAAHYAGPTDSRFTASSARLVYGMTKRQVLALVGPPEKTVGRCWQYRVNKLIRGTLLNAERVCFESGAYSDLQLETDGAWNRPIVVPPVTQ